MGTTKDFLKRTFSSSKKKESTETNKSPTTQGGFLSPSSGNPYTSGAPATRRPSGSGLNPFAQQRATNDPPPAYTPGPTYSVPAAASTAATPTDDAPISSDNDKYAFLREFDTIFLIDDSASMTLPVSSRSYVGPSRWDQVQSALEVIAPICAERDADGVDIWFINKPKIWENVCTAGNIIEIFQEAEPRGGTFTGKRLLAILRPYMARYRRDPDNTKQINIIVITDGEAQDDVEGAITAVAKELDTLRAPPAQVGIQFFQVGDSAEATRYLKQLDNEISKEKSVRDIVDTTTFMSETGGELTGHGIMKVVLGSVMRRLDRDSTDVHRD